MTWYKEGLRFKCTGCGNCCTGAPGYVWVDDQEIEEMAHFLKITREEFEKKYTRVVQGKRSLLEHPKNYDCIFLKDKKCMLYSARPRQCRTFPWWKENLSSPAAWKEAARWCEGISEDAPLISLGEIRKDLDVSEGLQP